MTKAPLPTEIFQTAKRQHKHATKNVDYTTIANRFMAVSLRNNGNQTGVVKPT